MLSQDDVAGLLAAKREAAPRHFFHHILVANRTANHRDAELAECDFEADVAHDGGDNSRLRQLVLVLQMPGRHQQDGITVYGPALVVGEQSTVAVAVERDPEPGPVLDHGVRERVEMSGP